MIGARGWTFRQVGAFAWIVADVVGADSATEGASAGVAGALPGLAEVVFAAEAAEHTAVVAAEHRRSRLTRAHLVAAAFLEVERAEVVERTLRESCVGGLVASAEANTAGSLEELAVLRAFAGEVFLEDPSVLGVEFFACGWFACDTDLIATLDRELKVLTAPNSSVAVAFETVLVTARGASVTREALDLTAFTEARTFREVGVGAWVCAHVIAAVAAVEGARADGAAIIVDPDVTDVAPFAVAVEDADAVVAARGRWGIAHTRLPLARSGEERGAQGVEIFLRDR